MKKRLNTVISDEHFKALKVAAAESGMTMSRAVESLIEDVLYKVNLPASGPRPEAVSGGSVPDADAAQGPSTGAAGNQPSREELTELVQDEIVECDVCGQPLPRSALKLHRENCLRAKQGYWDQRAFRS